MNIVPATMVDQPPISPVAINENTNNTGKISVKEILAASNPELIMMIDTSRNVLKSEVLNLGVAGLFEADPLNLVDRVRPVVEHDYDNTNLLEFSRFAVDAVISSKWRRDGSQINDRNVNQIVEVIVRNSLSRVMDRYVSSGIESFGSDERKQLRVERLKTLRDKFRDLIDEDINKNSESKDGLSGRSVSTISGEYAIYDATKRGAVMRCIAEATDVLDVMIFTAGVEKKVKLGRKKLPFGVVEHRIPSSDTMTPINVISSRNRPRSH